MPANADFVVEVDAAARAWLESHKSERPRVITYDVHRCCGCGMTVDPATAAYRSFLKGETYYFCSASCKANFDRDPGKYVRAGGKGGREGH